MISGFLRWDDLFKLLGMSRTAIWREEKNGTFPCRRQLGPNSVGWLEDEVKEWMESRPKATKVNSNLRKKKVKHV
jgi:prophage regulatory protein